MIKNPYAIVDGSALIPIGRGLLLERIQSDLERLSASHVSVVGPRMMGKSPLLASLAQRLGAGQGGYVAVAFWDLSHNTPVNDDEFKAGLAVKVREALAGVIPDIADLVTIEGPLIIEELMLVLDELASQNTRLLVILDEMDSLFSSAQLSRNLWDNLRSLAQKKSLRLATGSRIRLRELCRTEESRTSDFWELFPNPIPLGPLTSDHILEASGELIRVGAKLNQSGAKEIRQWTGGHPALVGCFLELLCEKSANGEVGNETIRDIAGEVFGRSRDCLGVLWEDLAIEDQMALLKLSEAEVDASTLQRATIQGLAERGLAEESGGRVVSSSRFAARYAKEQGPSVDRIATLFSDRKSYLAYIKPTLELRLKQISGGDDELRGFIERALRDLHPDPGFAISWARNISTRALRVVWARESPDGRSIPPEWITAWKGNLASDHVQRLVADCSKRSNCIPQEGGQQLRVLRFATGVDQVRRESKFLTKPAFELLNFVHAIGDYGQHKDDEVTQGVATAFCHAAVELFAALYEST